MRFESALRATLDEVDDFSRLTFDDWQQTLCESKDRLAAYQ